MWYYVWFSLAALCAVICAVKTFVQKRTNPIAPSACMMFIAAAMVNISYPIRIGASSYFMASLTTSIYLVCLDFLVLSMMHFALEFTQSKVFPIKYKKKIFAVLDFFVIVDEAILIANVFHELELRYQYEPDSIYAIKYMYVARPSFYFHLGFVYLLLCMVIYLLVWKTFSVPKIYRSRYSNSLLTVLVIAAVSLLYVAGALQISVDVTALIFGFVCPIVYWNAFDYSSKGMLNSTRKVILEYMGMPMILFDYEGYVADSNKDMRSLFPILNSQAGKISMVDFMQIAAIRELQNTNTDQMFEWHNPGDVGARIYQCNFICLKDEKDRSIGHLLLMKNMELEKDMLTQLYSKQCFYERMAHVVNHQMYPITVVICNANGIGLVNDVYGWTKGNEMLRLAADLLRDNLPPNVITARLDDCDMAVGFTQIEQEYAVRLFENIREQYRQANDTGINTDLEYGIAVIRDDSKSVEQAVKEASESMRTKKLMNETSQKSSQLDSLKQTLTESDYETEEHVERTKAMAIKLGRALNLTDADLGKLALLAVLHDIGKIAIPHSILLKPGKLTDEEWEVMKTHTEKGYRIANASKELKPIAEYILHHHERWDGQGYPGGLSGEEIPILSRIITVVDSHDVMVHDRPYHKAMSHAEAVEELLRCSGSQFDPHIVTAFLQVLQEEKETQIRRSSE